MRWLVGWLVGWSVFRGLLCGAQLTWSDCFISLFFFKQPRKQRSLHFHHHHFGTAYVRISTISTNHDNQQDASAGRGRGGRAGGGGGGGGGSAIVTPVTSSSSSGREDRSHHSGWSRLSSQSSIGELSLDRTTATTATMVSFTTQRATSNQARRYLCACERASACAGFRCCGAVMFWMCSRVVCCFFVHVHYHHHQATAATAGSGDGRFRQVISFSFVRSFVRSSSCVAWLDRSFVRSFVRFLLLRIHSFVPAFVHLCQPVSYTFVVIIHTYRYSHVCQVLRGILGGKLG